MGTRRSMCLVQVALRAKKPVARLAGKQVGQRAWSSSPMRPTDGVYEAITNMRTRTPWIEALRKSRQSTGESIGDQEAPIKPDVTPRTMKDSFVKFVLPLAQDPWLLDRYANSSGQIRLGSLLMDLDALSGVVAYKHTGEGVSTVTAAVDRINIRNPLTEICDLELSGQVTFATGRSSMEITLQIAKAPPTSGGLHILETAKPEDVFMNCVFTMVALDSVTKKPINIAPLELTTQAERALYAKGEENHKAKKALKQANIMQKAPDAEESALIHKMWTESLAFADSSNPIDRPSNTTPMSKSTVHSAQIMQPQYRNRHSFMIFGGFLLKQTFELAFTCAASFSHSRPAFLNLDPSTFESPVPVGSVLYASAGVTYTEADTLHGGTRIQVMVRTHVRNVEHAEHERKETGTFFYTFHVDNEVSVLPQSYSDFMRWVGGRRRAQQLRGDLQTQQASNTVGKIDGKRATE